MYIQLIEMAVRVAVDVRMFIPLWSVTQKWLSSFMWRPSITGWVAKKPMYIFCDSPTWIRYMKLWNRDSKDQNMPENSGSPNGGMTGNLFRDENGSPMQSPAGIDDVREKGENVVLLTHFLVAKVRVICNIFKIFKESYSTTLFAVSNFLGHKYTAFFNWRRVGLWCGHS